jgi:hypothetical protein
MKFFQYLFYLSRYNSTRKKDLALQAMTITLHFKVL